MDATSKQSSATPSAQHLFSVMFGSILVAAAIFVLLIGIRSAVALRRAESDASRDYSAMQRKQADLAGTYINAKPTAIMIWYPKSISPPRTQPVTLNYYTDHDLQKRVGFHLHFDLVSPAHDFLVTPITKFDVDETMGNKPQVAWFITPQRIGFNEFAINFVEYFLDVHHQRHVTRYGKVFEVVYACDPSLTVAWIEDHPFSQLFIASLITLAGVLMGPLALEYYKRRWSDESKPDDAG